MIKRSCIIIGNGYNTLKDIKSAEKEFKPPNKVYIICCDGACEFLRRYKIAPNVIIGDLDSITDTTYRYFKRKKVKIIKLKNQYKNDLEKAIEHSIKQGYNELLLTGVTGKRLDHTINNLSIIKKHSQKVKMLIYENGYKGLLIGKNYKTEIEKGKIVSLIPFPKAEGITTKGLKYRLNKDTLELGKREGALNKSERTIIEIRYKKGLILLITEQ